MNMVNNDDNNWTAAMLPATVSFPGGKQSNAHFKLLPFWQENPALVCPAEADCVLANRNVIRELNKNCLVVEALLPDSLRLVIDLIEQVSVVNPNIILKG